MPLKECIKPSRRFFCWGGQISRQPAGRSRNKNEIHIQIEIGIPLFGKEIMGYTPSAVQLFVISRSPYI